jgi:hypothetical protein
MFFITFGIPAFCDAFSGVPDYFHYPRFALAMHDDTTSLIYYSFINLVPLLWWLTTPAKAKLQSAAIRRRANATSSRLPKLLAWAGAAGLVSPICLLPFAPNPMLYLGYARSIFGNNSQQEMFFNQFVQMATMLSVCVSIAILINARRVSSLHLYLIPILLADIWINGKRFIVLTLAVFLCFVFWHRGTLKGRTLVGTMLLVAALAVGYSQLYQITLRPYYQSQTVDKYLDFRLDVGRDHSLKTSIYSQLYDQQLLPYSLHAVVFYSTLFIPRSLWENKPQAYATYFTCYVFKSPIKWLGFGFTTTVFGEALDNCSWWGLLVGPCLIAAICRLGDLAARELTKMLAIFVGSAFLILQLSGFLPIVLMWIGLMLSDRHARKSVPRRFVRTGAGMPAPLLMPRFRKV